MRIGTWPGLLAAAAAMALPGGATGHSGPEKMFQDCDACPVMMTIAPGTYVMGWQEWDQGFSHQVERATPAHTVTIAYAFAIGRYEVTVAEYEACVEAGVCTDLGREARSRGTLRDDHPIPAGWEAAQAYAAWLSELTGQAYRLPSEAEWEYVVRAGATGLNDWAEHHFTCKDNGLDPDSEGEPHLFGCYLEPVGSFAPNAFGLYDLLGNAAEWTADCWHDSFFDDVGGGIGPRPDDGSAWTEPGCGGRVLKDDSGSFGPLMVWPSNRSVGAAYHPEGFRLVREAE